MSFLDTLRKDKMEALKTKEALSLTPADRMDLIEETKRKIEILEAYLPKQMSADELQAAILEILEEKQLERSNKSKGILIKETLARYPGKTDGKAVNQALDQLL